MKTKILIILCSVLLSCPYVLGDGSSYEGIWYYPIEYQGLADCAYAYGPTTDTSVNPPSNLEIPSNAVVDHRSKTVLGIRKNAFAGLRMESVSLPKNLVYMGENAFSQCTILKKVNFTGSCSYRLWTLDKIPAGAFSDCWYLQDINLPSTVQSLGDKAFYNCRSFYSFTLSDNINYIGEKAFAGCDNLRTVISLNLTPPELKSYRTEQFSDGEKQLYDNFDFNRDIKLYVPGNAVESYKNAPGWNQFAYILPLSEIPVSKIELSDRKLSIRLNQTGAQIRAKVYPSIISNRHVEWSSSNDEIVSVEPNPKENCCGDLFPHKPGKAEIKAEIDGLCAICEVEVTYIAANSIIVEPSEVSINGEYKIIEVITNPIEAEPYLIFSSDNPEIAVPETLMGYNIIRAKKPGQCVIYIDGGNAVAKCTVSVPVTLPSSVSLNKYLGIIKPEEMFTLTAKIEPAITSDKTIIWHSDNPYVASVDENGNVMGNHVGICNITAQCGDKFSKRCEVSVVPESIKFEQDKIQLKVGDSIEVSITSNPYSDAIYDALSSYSWDKEIANIAIDNRTIKAKKIGKTKIQVSWKKDLAYYGWYQSPAEIEVEVLPVYAESLSLTPSEWNATVGESIKIIPTILPENSSRKTVELKSSNPSVVKVGWSTNSPIEAVEVGKAIVYASVFNNDHDVTAECHVTVRAPEILVSSISLSPSSVEDQEGEQIQITATILPEDATNKVICWSSSDESIAIVDDTGLISLVKKGTAVITASATDDSGVSAECPVVVSELGGIEDVIADKSVYVKIFNLKGVLVYEGTYSEAPLLPDYYVIVCNGKNIKIKVK